MSEETQVGMIDLSVSPVGADGGLPKCRRVPYDVYKFRIKEEPKYEAESKSSGLPMLIFVLEQMSPDKIVNKETGIAETPLGLEYTFWCSLAPGKTMNLVGIHKACNLPLKFQLHPETGLPMGISYTGKELFALASSETANQQKDDGNGGKVDIINPLTGKPFTNERKQINRVVTAD